MESPSQNLSPLRNKLIYIGDPMCSWCWGIAPHIQKLIDTFSSRLEFELILGGLRPGGGDDWQGYLRHELREHWTHVQAASGQPFNFGFLKRENFNYDTEPPSRAIRVVRDLAPESEFAFFKAIQHNFYAQNNDPTSLNFYVEICRTHKIDFDTFSQEFNSQNYQQLVLKDFFKAKRYGVRAFPTVLLEKLHKREVVSYGYSNFKQMSARITGFLAEEN